MVMKSACMVSTQSRYLPLCLGRARTAGSQPQGHPGWHRPTRIAAASSLPDRRPRRCGGSPRCVSETERQRCGGRVQSHGPERRRQLHSSQVPQGSSRGERVRVAARPTPTRKPFLGLAATPHTRICCTIEPRSGEVW